MLHIVQVVFAGAAETPQVFLDQAQAEAAFVTHVRKIWKQSYPGYCERSGVAPDSFAAAKAFLETLDLAEVGKVNYWILDPPDSGLDTVKDLEALKQRQEQLGRLVRQVEQRAAAVGGELNGLLDDIARLGEDFGEMDSESVAAQPVAAEGGAVPTPAPAVQIELDENAEKYTTPEWKKFVGLITNISGGSRSDFPLLDRQVWRQEVYSDATHLEYWEWVAMKIDIYKEAAEKAGYTIVDDPDTPGHFRFRTPEGEMDETSFSVDWEAWCDAGMHLAQKAAAENK